MSHNIGKKILKIFLWIVVTVVILVVSIPVLLYIPAIQDFAIGIVTEKLSESTGMKIGVDRLRLRFPLKLSVDGASVIQENGDTMLTAENVLVNVKMRPLFSGKIEVSDLNIRNTFYQLGNNDSTLWLRARLNKADIEGTDLVLKDNKLDLENINIDGIKISLQIKEDTVAAPVDTTKSAPWNINLKYAEIKNLSYSMRMYPTIDSLGCEVAEIALADALIDMGSKKISGKSLKVDSVMAAYIYPASIPYEKLPQKKEEITLDSEEWTITADTLMLNAKRGLYAEKGRRPAAGFDPSYIDVSDVEIVVNTFFNKGQNISVPLTKLSAHERCGLQLYAEGTFSMNSGEMSVKDFGIETLRSSIRMNALMGAGDLVSDPNVALTLKATATIDPKDVALAFPSLKAMLSPLQPISLSADIDGISSLLNIYNLDLRMAPVLKVNIQGAVTNPFDDKKIGGDLAINGSLSSINDQQFKFLPIKSLPAMEIKGNLAYHPGEADGEIEISTREGRLAGTGNWVAKTEGYNADLRLDKFPVDAFMPELGLGDVTAFISVNGLGYNPMDKNTSINANINLDEIEYNKQSLHDLSLSASLHNGNVNGLFTSDNHDADFKIDFDADLINDTVIWDLNSKILNLDLQALGLSDSINGGHVDLLTSGRINLSDFSINATAQISDLNWHFGKDNFINPSAIDIDIESDTILRSKLMTGDMAVSLWSSSPLMPFISGLSSGMDVVTSQIDDMKIDVNAISNAFPQFQLMMDMGPHNLISQYLSQSSNMTFNRMTAGIHNDSLINMNTFITGFRIGDTKIDTISFNAIQRGQFLAYDASVNNRPGTFDDFAHVKINGFAGSNRLSLFFKQENIKNEKGFNLGLSASLLDSVVTVKFVPLNPIIAYQPWTFNSDNFISFDIVNKHIDANLSLTGDKSYIKLFTEHNEDADLDHSVHDIDEKQEDLVLQISRIRLQDWLSINPFAPPMKGDLNADLRFNYDKGILTGAGNASLDDFYYGKERVGSFNLDLNVSNSANGKLMADVSLMVDSVKTITARGVLNDSTASSPFLLDFKMIRFPLTVVNPFIPDKMATLSGMLNGEMTITGDMAKPVFNGFIDFDTTEVKVKMLGTSFKFSDEKIPVDSGIVSFDNFTIYGCNENPLNVDGKVNARNIANLGMDLTLTGKNVQVVNSDRPRGADVYGKAFLDIDASVKGDMRYMRVDADVSLLSGTNVTYVLAESTQSLSTKQNDVDMVHFVQFNDTASVNMADSLVSTGMILSLDAGLHIASGCSINVDLNTNGSNKVSLQPSGDLNYTMSAFSGDRLTGRININGGYVRYTPPLMSEKNFAFKDGSYVAFTGDMMNPTLNIHAVDVVKANVTQSGQNSRLVNFDVGLSLTNTLENLNVAFDLSTDDDITVQNELASMSAEQRANQAMNLLLYNVYSGGETKGNANLTGNQLYSFLASQLNTWAANNIRGVDISFGIDQYDRTYGGSTSTTTSYSYRISKTFLNDRFKIIVGGNYSTDADADENFSQNLINDISFEYMLNRAGSMYVRIFRHTGYESILEGEITQTGVGFVLKRKLNSLKDLFRFRKE